MLHFTRTANLVINVEDFIYMMLYLLEMPAICLKPISMHKHAKNSITDICENCIDFIIQLYF